MGDATHSIESVCTVIFCEKSALILICGDMEVEGVALQMARDIRWMEAVDTNDCFMCISTGSCDSHGCRHCWQTLYTLPVLWHGSTSQGLGTHLLLDPT